MLISIIIPCYNEQDNIRDVISQIELVDNRGCDIEYILVNNGSTDSTATVMKECAKNTYTKNIRFTKVETNIGYGFGIQQGVKVATGQYVGWIHADLQVHPKELEQFFSYIRFNQGKKLFLKGQRHNRGAMDRFFTFGQSKFNSVLFHKRMSDIGAIPVIASRDLFDNIENMPNDFSFELFVYLKALKSNYLVKRFDVFLANRQKGASSWNKGFSSKIKQSKRIILDSFKIKKGQKVL